MKTSTKLAITAILALSISTPIARSEDGSDSSKIQSENSDSQSKSATTESQSKSVSSESKSPAENSDSKVAVDNSTPKVSSVQSAARPFNLDIAGPVYTAGSDARSANFQAKDLPAMMQALNQSSSEGNSFSHVASKSLDPSKLALSTDSQVRVYFLGDGTGLHNTLGFNTTGSGVQQGSPKLIFPDASTHASGSEGGSNGGLRSASAPLVSGDFVDLGTLKAGQKLDFFIIANGAENNPGLSQIWTANAAGKSDGLHHVSAYAVKDSPYLILNFSTTGGGDKSSRNLVFAVEIGSKNIMALANPEPHAILTFVLLGATVCVVRRRMGRSPESVPA